ncbi:MAG: TetR/AcrR family transcriptional regulator [Rhodospirillaceae bacterium]|nr:TetR/AcrR family transcriptional regulator [Rhodospirillaceae bacterium]
MKSCPRSKPGKTAAAPRRRREPRIRAIVAAAEQVFLERGYEAGSLDDVARRANASKATIYAHFGSKVGLFRAIIGEKINEIFEPVRQGEAHHAPVPIVLHGLGTAFLRRMLSPVVLKFYRLIVSQGTQFPELAQTWFANGPKTAIATLAAFLRERHASGEIVVATPDLAAEFFLMSLRGVLHLQAVTGLIVPPFDKAIAAKVSAAVEMFMRAYAPQRVTQRRGR